MVVVSTHKRVNFKAKHHLHLSYDEKSNIESIQCIKDRIESFDDHFACTKSMKNNKSKTIRHITNWFDIFVNYYN
jgi:archaellum component FlaC